MTTEQDTKDARQITIVILVAIAAILLLAYGWPYIFGQVEVKQSVKTNGQTIVSCLGKFKDCKGSSVFMQLLQGGTIKLAEKQGEVLNTTAYLSSVITID